MIARQCITVSGVKTLLLLLITIMANGGKWGVDTLGSESFPTCLPLRLASRGPSEVLSYLLDQLFTLHIFYLIQVGENKMTLKLFH